LRESEEGEPYLKKKKVLKSSKEKEPTYWELQIRKMW